MAQPAPAILASTLFDNVDQTSSTIEDCDAEKPLSWSRKRKRIGTGCVTVNEALGGGLAYGEGGMCCISGEKGVGKSVLSTHLLTTHLLATPSASAVLIDTTGTFDVLRLYSTILCRLRKQSALRTAQTAANSQLDAGNSQAGQEQDDQALADEATNVLARVKIMRVFDLTGVIEGVDEVREGLEGMMRATHAEKEVDEARGSVHQTTRSSNGGERRRKIGRIETGIADSEDEEEEEEEEEDVLFGGASAVTTGSIEAITAMNEHGADSKEREAGQADRGVGMIIVDNITQAVSPLMKSKYVQAHSLLTSFLRTLSHLTRTHDLSTILINGVLPMPPARPSNRSYSPLPPPLTTTTQQPLAQEGQPTSASPDPTPSIFVSNTARPALGKTFPYFVDVHLLVSRLPRGKQDAERFYTGAREETAGRVVEFVNVVEVVQDRYGDGVGRWGAFVIEEGGEIRGV